MGDPLSAPSWLASFTWRHPEAQTQALVGEKLGDEGVEYAVVRSGWSLEPENSDHEPWSILSS